MCFQNPGWTCTLTRPAVPGAARSAAHQLDPVVERERAVDQPRQPARHRRVDARIGECARQQRHRLQRLDSLPDASSDLLGRDALGQQLASAPVADLGRERGRDEIARGPARPAPSTPAARRAWRRSSRPRRRCGPPRRPPRPPPWASVALAVSAAAFFAAPASSTPTGSSDCSRRRRRRGHPDCGDCPPMEGRAPRRSRTAGTVPPVRVGCAAWRSGARPQLHLPGPRGRGACRCIGAGSSGDGRRGAARPWGVLYDAAGAHGRAGRAAGTPTGRTRCTCPASSCRASCGSSRWRPGSTARTTCSSCPVAGPRRGDRGVAARGPAARGGNRLARPAVLVPPDGMAPTVILTERFRARPASPCTSWPLPTRARWRTEGWRGGGVVSTPRWPDNSLACVSTRAGHELNFPKYTEKKYNRRRRG